MPKMRYFLEINLPSSWKSAPIRPSLASAVGALPPDPCVFIYSYHYKTLWICTKSIAIKSQFQTLVFMTVMALQTIHLILFCQRT